MGDAVFYWFGDVIIIRYSTCEQRNMSHHVEPNASRVVEGEVGKPSAASSATVNSQHRRIRPRADLSGGR